MRRAAPALFLFAACASGGAPVAERAGPRPAPREQATEAERAAPEAERDSARGGVEELYRSGRYDELIARLEGGERDESALRLIARAHLRRGRVQEALAALDRIEEPSLAASVDRGEALLRRGRVHEAREHLMRPIAAYNEGRIDRGDADGLFAVARAARALGSPKDANAAFREASAARAGDPDIELAWASLFLEAHAPAEAGRSLRIALAAAPDDPDAHALLAEVRFALGRPIGLAKEAADAALERNHGHVGARVFLAGLAIRRRDHAEAARHLEIAESVDPIDPRLVATKGALAWSLDRADELAALERRALEANPRHAGFYETIAGFAEYAHRYAEGVELADRALAIEPESARALARRGINLLRLAREDEGRSALEEAFRRDPFDLRVFNTLELFDRTIDAHYELVERAPFTFRMHRSERRSLERHVPKLVDEAYRALSSRYRFRPEPPIQIELYADADDFAIRTSGLPGLGLQGVCFGHVVTAVSPRGGPFNWGQILWHELAHVFHLQLSRSRVPRWLAEGLAERETELSPHGFVRPMDHQVAASLRAGKVPSLADFDALFFSARSSRELVLAYALAAEAGAFLDERFGAGAIRALLVGFGDGKTLGELAPAALGVELDALDAAFSSHLRAKLARFEGQLLPYAPVDREAARHAARKAPEDAGAAARHARALLLAGERAGARGEALRAIALDEGHPEARFVLAKLELGRSPARAAAHLERLLERGDGVEPRLLLADIAARDGRREEALAHLARAEALDPRRREPHELAWRLAREAGDREAEIEALEAVTALEIHAREPHLALLELLAESGDHERLAEVGERAVFVAPHEPRVHEARLLAASHLGRAGEALTALDDLLALDVAPRSDALERAAKALEVAGRTSAARSIRRRAPARAAPKTTAR